MTEQGRIQDGTINDADEFWQLVQDVAYIIEGESRDYEREKLHWLALGLMDPERPNLLQPLLFVGRHGRLPSQDRRTSDTVSDMPMPSERQRMRNCSNRLCSR